MSNSHACTEERFLQDVANHSIKIIKDDGVHRHISFTNNGSNCYRFDLITWPGSICYTGDMGTYVFSRLDDMFKFFKMSDNDFNKNPNKQLNINPYYWGQKLQAIGTNAGYEEFDSDKFIKEVTEYYDEYIIDHPDPDKKLWEEVIYYVLNYAYDGKERAYVAISDYSSSYGLDFTDFFDGGGGDTSRYTFRYIWCLYAIVWGIQQYDKK